MQLPAHGSKNGSQVVHAGIASGRQHAVQTLAWLGGQRGKLLKTDGGIDKIAHDQAGNLGFAVEKQGGGLTQKRLRK